ncbi:MAG: hypothetical protein IPL96_07575 [Holophagaceae bacterium]|nr:hypothetical protein [Holophagaceae bacterium]
MDETNPYAPPAADLETGAPSPPPFFAVSTPKLIVMSFATFSFYLIYYFYKQWRALGAYSRESFWPIPRAIFYPIMSFDFFKRLADAARLRGIAVDWNPVALPVMVLVANAFRLAPTPWSLLVFVHMVPIFLANPTVVAVNHAVSPEADPNRRFSVWNWIAIVLGAGFWVLVVLGTILTVLQPAVDAGS